jgi:hypothetical protein
VEELDQQREAGPAQVAALRRVTRHLDLAKECFEHCVVGWVRLLNMGPRPGRG